MAKKQEGPLPDDAEDILRQFFEQLDMAGRRKEARARLEKLHDAIGAMDAAGRDFVLRLEDTAKAVFDVADEATENDPVASLLLLDDLRPTLEALRDRVRDETQAEDEPPAEKQTRKRKQNWVLDSPLLNGLVAFGKRAGYPSQWPSETSGRKYLRLFGRTHRPTGPDWLSIFLLREIVRVWATSTEFHPYRTTDGEIRDPDHFFHLRVPGSRLRSPPREKGRGRRRPVALRALVAALARVAPEIGATRITRRVVELWKETKVSHPELTWYLEDRGKNGVKALEREINSLRQKFVVKKAKNTRRTSRR